MALLVWEEVLAPEDTWQCLWEEMQCLLLGIGLDFTLTLYSLALSSLTTYSTPGPHLWTKTPVVIPASWEDSGAPFLISSGASLPYQGDAKAKLPQPAAENAGSIFIWDFVACCLSPFLLLFIQVFDVVS